MSKLRLNNSILTSALFLAMGSLANADWVSICPGPMMRFSNPYGNSVLSSKLFSVSVGSAGTIAYNAVNGMPPGCFPGAITANTTGRIGFGTGTEGSYTTTIDNRLALTLGMGQGDLTVGGISGVGGNFSYAMILEDATQTVFGSTGFNTFFGGASDKYVFGRTTNGTNTRIELRADLVGDSARLDWGLTNIDPVASHRLGLSFGQHVAIAAADGSVSSGTPYSLTLNRTPGYITVPGIKPPSVEQRFTRASDPSGFPSRVNFMISQDIPYGLRVENTVSDATTDSSSLTSSQTNVDEFVIGQAFFLLGAPSGGNPTSFPDFIFNEPKSDSRFLGDNGYIQKWRQTVVSPGSTRKIISFYRSTWGDSLYGRPYSIVVDTPKIINLDANNPAAFEQNPFTVRVWVDNNRGFATVDQDIPIDDVKVELLLPDGLTAVGGAVKRISRVNPRDQQSVDFTVQADDTASGDLTYQVRVSPNPGPVKTVTGVIQAVSQPRITLRSNANLVSSPWIFAEPVWETILGLRPDADYTAFNYDPIQKAYVISAGPVRGIGTWIIAKNEAQITLGGSPVSPPDANPSLGTSAPGVDLQPGWNLIANPYPVAFQIGELVGVSAANNTGSFTFAELVAQNAVSSSLAFWDTGKQAYDFIQRTTDRLEPQRGYWIFVKSAQPVRLAFPPIFTPGVRSTATPTVVSAPWQQTDKQWRLMLAARGATATDDQNFIGMTTSADAAQKLRIYEPPIAPIKGAISLSIEKTIGAVTERLTQSLSDQPGKQEFDVKVESTEAGPVTVTWPNLSTIPKNIRVRLVDTETGETRDLRKVSGYTYQAGIKSTKSLKIQLETGVASRAIIGNVVVSQTGRSGSGSESVRIAYALGSDATTTIRVLNNKGAEQAILASGRSSRAGQNEIAWNLRDAANRSVAPGTYRVEIVVEGADGERMRKVVLITVVR
jgi:hypothetical protein